jgi:hypothetical protein
MSHPHSIILSPEELAALLNPCHEELLIEDAEVRIYRVTIPPGATLSPVGPDGISHFNCVLEGSRGLLAGAPGTTIWELSYVRGQTAFVRSDGTEPRSITNRGEEPIRFLRIELKEPL